MDAPPMSSARISRAPLTTMSMRPSRNESADAMAVVAGAGAAMQAESEVPLYTADLTARLPRLRVASPSACVRACACVALCEPPLVLGCQKEIDLDPPTLSVTASPDHRDGNVGEGRRCQYLSAPLPLSPPRVLTDFASSRRATSPCCLTRRSALQAVL